MTLEEAKCAIPCHSAVEKLLCDYCSSNDDYCTGKCDVVGKVNCINLLLIQKSYARNDGDVYKLRRYIQRLELPDTSDCSDCGLFRDSFGCDNGGR